MSFEDSSGEYLEEPLPVELNVFESLEDQILGVNVSEPLGANQSSLGLLIPMDSDDLPVTEILLVLPLPHTTQ